MTVAGRARMTTLSNDIGVSKERVTQGGVSASIQLWIPVSLVRSRGRL